ncbi:Rib/alpha-like domain-containing protein, partial [Streptococcus marmotae]
MNLNKKQKFAIRKLTIGVCSVVFGILMTTPAVLAQENTTASGDDSTTAASSVAETNKVAENPELTEPKAEDGQVPKNPTSQGFMVNEETREVAETTPWRDSFDKGDFDDAVEKTAEREHVLGFYPQKGEPPVEGKEEIGSIRYKWKEKEVTKGEEYEGWTLKSGNSFNVVQPETPEYIKQNMERYQRRKVTGDKGEVSYVIEKIDPYELGDKDKSKVYEINKADVLKKTDGISGEGYLIKGTPKPASIAAESASIAPTNYYRSPTSTRFVELKNQGTEIQSQLYKVNPNSTIRFHFSYKGAFDSWEQRSGDGEQGIGYLVDQDGNVLTTADGKTTEIVNLGGGVFGYSEGGAFYKIPENVTGVRMVLKAGEKSKLYPNHQDAGYIFDNVGLELGAALNHKQTLTKIPKEGANVTGEGTYGKDDVYTRGDKIKYVLNVKNEGGITAANVKTKIVVPEGVSLDGPLPAGYTYDEASRTITVPDAVYGASGDLSNGFQDYSAGPALAVMKSRDITLNFKVDDNTDKQGVFFKATTTYTNSTYTWSNGVSVRGSVTSQEGLTGPQQPLYIDTKAPVAPIVDSINTAAKVIPVDVTAAEKENTEEYTDGGGIKLKLSVIDPASPDTPIFTVEATRDDKGVWTLPNGTVVEKNAEGKLELPVPEGTKLKESELSIVATIQDKYKNESGATKANITNKAPEFEVPTADKPADPIEKGSTFTDDQIKALVTNITDEEDDSDKADTKEIGAVMIVDKGGFDPNKVDEYTIKVSVTDSDGKKTEKTFVLKVEDKTAPKAPTIGTVDTAATKVPVTPKDDDVTSVAVTFPGEKDPVIVEKDKEGVWKLPDGTEVSVDESGALQVPVPADAKLVPGDDKITATATDASKNTSDEGKGKITNEKPVVTAKDQTAETGKSVDLTKDVVITDKEDDASDQDAKTTQPPTYLIVKPDGSKVTLTKEEAKAFVPDQAGEHTVTIVTRDSDGLEGSTTVKLDVVTAAPKPKPSLDKDKYQPGVGIVTVPQGTRITNDDVLGKVTIPEGSGGTAVVTGMIPSTDQPGDKGTVTVVVTYPDGSSDSVEVPVKVTEVPKPVEEKDKDKYQPGVGIVTVPQGTRITNDDVLGKVTIPEGSGGTAVVTGMIPSTDQPGDK